MRIKVCDYCTKVLEEDEGIHVDIVDYYPGPYYLDDDMSTDEKSLDFCNYECLDSFCKSMISNEKKLGISHENKNV